MDERAGQGSGSDHRKRRSHRKSRNGCTKCKLRRIKCDEGTPRCSRCEKMDLICEYPRQTDGQNVEEDWLDIIDPLLQQLEVSGVDGGSEGVVDPSLLFPGAAGPSSSSPAPSGSPSQALLELPKDYIGSSQSLLLSPVAQALAPAEFELLTHYLEHTSRDLTVDNGDQYTLQIGIPSLACTSKPLMKSVLAIAAVCRCCDIINQLPVSHEARGQVIEFLSLADHYHRESLREIQATLPGARNYDHILANAAMMGMYGSGSHCVRIWLAKTTAFGDPPLGDFMPKYSQWINFYRAVHIAYAGIRNENSTQDEVAPINRARSPVGFMANAGFQVQYECNAPSPIEHLRAPANHTLYPVLSATVGSALLQLNEKAREVACLQASEFSIDMQGLVTAPSSDSYSELQSCFAALELLKTVVAETFTVDTSMLTPPDQVNFDVESDTESVPQLSGISPWLQKYTASITSSTPSRLPRRFIMAFIHKVPSKYLSLVEDMLGLIQADTPGNDQPVWGAGMSITPEPSIRHRLAMDIFAHWLVLLILLDNVWWIGGIGAWELKRIVSFRKDVRWNISLWDRDEHWWPESMFEINRQFEKHRTNMGLP